MEICYKTRYAFIWSQILNAPLWAMYGLLVFIFYKDLHATPLQITLLISSKPVVAIFSFYWNSFVDKRRELLKKSIMLASFLGAIPCLFFPVVDNNWFYIFAFALYMMSSRAIVPAWMEILKMGIDSKSRAQVFSTGSTINYLTSLFFPLLVSYWMDVNPGVWRWIFLTTAVISFLSVFLLAKIPFNFISTKIEEQEEINLRNLFIKPWHRFLSLLTRRPDFAHFQIIFMLGGLGLMIMQPALPIFTLEILNLSYTELVIAISICKGLGFAMTTRSWASLFNKLNIYFLTFFMTFLAALFPLFLMIASVHLIWVYMAYLVYGVMQAGSELCWNLSGPHFAGKENSSEFTGVNVALVSIRGFIGPFLGTTLGVMSNSYLPLIVGGLFCLTGSFYALYSARKLKTGDHHVAEIL